MIFKKRTSGGWVNKKELTNGQKCRIVSEAIEEDSNFLDKKGNPKKRIVAKVRFEGKDEAVNVELNRMTTDALMEAFGEDSIKWQGNTLTVTVESSIKDGKRVYSLYLKPEGYELSTNEEGYVNLVREGLQTPQGATKQVEDKDIPIINETDDINAELAREAEKDKLLAKIPF